MNLPLFAPPSKQPSMASSSFSSHLHPVNWILRMLLKLPPVNYILGMLLKLPPVNSRNFFSWATFPIFYGICMEEHTCEARLPHVNGNVVRNRGNWDKGAVQVGGGVCAGGALLSPMSAWHAPSGWATRGGAGQITQLFLFLSTKVWGFGIN